MSEQTVADAKTGLQKLCLKHPSGSSAAIYLHGAHLTSFKPADGKEVIFVSKQAVFAPPKAIRGGVPVCCPQFGNMGPFKAQHGFVRNSQFSVKAASPTSATLQLVPTDDQLQGQIGAFTVQVHVTLDSDSLTQRLEVTNTGGDSLKLTAAFHTYFSVGAIAQTKVQGLEGVKYQDNLQQRQECAGSDAAIQVDREVDRIYLQTPGKLQIVDGAQQRVITLEKTNFPDAVVWNPWIEKSKGMGDLGNEEYKEFICVEAALASSGPAEVAKGQSWTAQQVISAKSS